MNARNIKNFILKFELGIGDILVELFNTACIRYP